MYLSFLDDGFCLIFHDQMITDCLNNPTETDNIQTRHVQPHERGKEATQVNQINNELIDSYV